MKFFICWYIIGCLLNLALVTKTIAGEVKRGNVKDVKWLSAIVVVFGSWAITTSLLYEKQ